MSKYNQKKIRHPQLQHGVEVARAIEPIAQQHNAHAALGGSVLMKGHSKKDIDIIIYPHKGKLMKPQPFLQELKNKGIVTGGRAMLQPSRKSSMYNDKPVAVCDSRWGRIDIIFLQAYMYEM